MLECITTLKRILVQYSTLKYQCLPAVGTVADTEQVGTVAQEDTAAVDVQGMAHIQHWNSLAERVGRAVVEEGSGVLRVASHLP